MEIPLLFDIIVIFTLAVLVSLVFHRLKVPNLVGFLLVGLLIGPYGFGLIADAAHDIEILAEIGVILLLFTIGIEFSLANLIKIRKTVLLGGSLQVGLTSVFTILIASIFNIGLQESIFMGFLAALSSTAIVLKLLQEKGEINIIHGRTSLGILIFQDIIIVPMILIIPILAGKSTNAGQELLIMLGKAIGLIVFMYFTSRFLIPRLLHEVARTQSRELFLMTIMVLGFSIAWITSMIGLSLALGAFLAGLAISESDYKHHAFGNIIPFRDIFTSFFFVSIGMLLNTEFLIREPLLILMILLGVMGIKTIINGFVAFILGLPFRTTVMVGLILSQLGEFSFILAGIGKQNGFLTDEFIPGTTYYQLFLAVAVISMALTPFIFMMAPWISKQLLRLPISEKMRNGLKPIPEFIPEKVKNHLIIVGMGVNGHNLAKAAKIAEIPYLIIEFDADLVREENSKGEPILFGDATNESILKHAGIEDAEILVCVIGDTGMSYRITSIARDLNPKLHIIVRTKSLVDLEDLYDVGANVVIPEEYETSVEIFTRVLHRYMIPQNKIFQLVSELRSGGYSMFRKMDINSDRHGKEGFILPELEISTVKIAKASPVVGKSLSEINLRNRYKVTLVAIWRHDQSLYNPHGDEILLEGDILYLIGTPEKLLCLTQLFKKDKIPDCDEHPEEEMRDNE